MLKRKETSHLSRPWLERDPMASLFVQNAHSLKRTKLREKPYWGRAWRCSTMVKEPDPSDHRRCRGGGEDHDGCALVVRVAWGYEMAWSAKLFGRRQRCGSSPASGGARQQGGNWDDAAVATSGVGSLLPCHWFFRVSLVMIIISKLWFLRPFFWFWIFAI